MKDIQFVKTFVLNAGFKAEKEKDVKEIFNGLRRRIVELKLQNGAILSKHKAVEPITVLCLMGNGLFRAGASLEEEQKLETGTLITLEGVIEHKVIAKPELHLLVTKFKEN